MSIYVTLLKEIRENDNGNLKKLDKRYMNVELLITPERHTALVLPNKTQFYISNLFQDLHERRIVLIEYYDICHREFWDDEFYPKYLKKLEDEGWLKTKPRSTLPKM